MFKNVYETQKSLKQANILLEEFQLKNFHRENFAFFRKSGRQPIWSPFDFTLYAICFSSHHFFAMRQNASILNIKY